MTKIQIFRKDNKENVVYEHISQNKYLMDEIAQDINLYSENYMAETIDIDKDIYIYNQSMERVNVLHGVDRASENHVSEMYSTFTDLALFRNLQS